MCGICGLGSASGAGVDEVTLHRMADALVHRGPDAEGYFTDAYVGLANRRLAIIDLRGGNQPLSNEDGRIQVVSNGEIYNFRELRKNLESQGHRFKTDSDTEVIVHAYEQFGDDCVHQFNGMFAFALWDVSRRRLLIARDRLGKKPVYYARLGRDLAFSSEIGSLLLKGDIPREIRVEAIPLYLRLGYSPAPMTMFREVHKLPAGCLMVWEDGETTVKRYWDLRYDPKRLVTESEALGEMGDLLSDAVRLRLISDVPLGAFLSGGVDSSAVVAVMSRVSSSPVKTFTVAFKGEGSRAYDESPFARLVADRYRTEHTEVEVEQSVADLFPKIVSHYGEPFGDYSSVPSYYVSQAARRHVTVALSGDGGDEVFWGYPWYAEDLVSARSRSAWLAARGGAAKTWRTLLSQGLRAALSEARYGVNRAGQLAFGRNDLCDRWAERHAYWRKGRIEKLLPGSGAPGFFGRGTACLNDLAPAALHLRDLDLVSYLDFKGFLACDLLVKMDIASMANSLEVRSPFLDYRLVEYAASLPGDMKVRRGRLKRLLKEVARDWLPEEILTRPKMGFTPPVHGWFRNDMLPVAKDLLSEDRLRREGIFDPEVVCGLLREHEGGIGNHGELLWTLAFFEQWRDTFAAGTLSGPPA